MVRRLALVVVLTGVLVQLFAGVALAAESRALDQATCENSWGAGSQIMDGVWDAGSSTCSGDWAIVKLGDELTIPSDVTLVLEEDLHVQDGSEVTIYGEIVVDGLYIVVASLDNDGSITALIADIDESSYVENHGEFTIGILSVRDGSTFDNFNFGEVIVREFHLEVGSTFLNRCGSTFDVGTIYDQDPTYEEPCGDEPDDEDPPTEPPVILPVVVETTTTTTMAPTTTTEPAPTTTIVEVLGLQVEAQETLPMTGAGDAGTQGLVAAALVVAGMAALAASAAIARTED